MSSLKWKKRKRKSMDMCCLTVFHRYTLMWQSVRCYERREKCCLAALKKNYTRLGDVAENAVKHVSVVQRLYILRVFNCGRHVSATSLSSIRSHELPLHSTPWHGDIRSVTNGDVERTPSDLPSLTHLAWYSRIFDESHALTPHSGNLTHIPAQRKTIFLISQVFSFCGEKWEFTPVLLLLTLGLLIFMCGSIRHTAQWQCPGSKLVHSKWLCKCWLILGSPSTQFTVCGTVSI